MAYFHAILNSKFAGTNVLMAMANIPSLDKWWHHIYTKSIHSINSTATVSDT